MSSPKPDLLEMTFALMAEKRLTYREARQELGRRGAMVRASKRRRRELGRAILERRGLA